MRNNGVKATSARVIGGGTKSKEFMQILADIFGIEMKTITTKDGGALGAIILAMVGDGLYSSPEEAASKLVRDKDSYFPNPEKHVQYLEKFAKYKELYLKTK